MASILRIDELQSPTGNRVALFNSNGSVEQISVNSLLVNNNIKFPTWTTSTRPTANLQVGYSGFNTQTNQVEVYNGTAWVVFSNASKPNLPTGYRIAMTFDSSSGGLLPGSTWTISQPNGTAGTFVTSGGVGESGYFSDTGRSVNNNFFRIDQMPIVGTSTDLTFCIWYRGTQTVAPQTYGPAVPLFGDIRGSVYGGFGISSGRCEFRDSGNAYQGSLVNTGSWTHIAFSMTTANTLKIYTNGALTNTYTSVSINETYTRCSDIGAHYPYSGYAAPTSIDQAVVYERILTDAEVLQVYNSSNFSQ
jgi:hypothetical protein